MATASPSAEEIASEYDISHKFDHLAGNVREPAGAPI
jgi:hypothetical protein